MDTIIKKNIYPFLQGGGEMGALCRDYDWSQTAIGTPDVWPQSLRTTLSIILHSRFPMFLFWGPQSICFYNDAYRPSLGNEGKHPYALGKPGSEVWPEIWADIKPQIDQVLAGGEASWWQDQLLPIYRNGKLEDVYWTYSYSPVTDESGEPAGVFVTCTETTRTVETLQRLQLSEERFQNLVQQATVGMIVLQGEAMIVGIVNDQYGQLIGRTTRELLGKPLFTIIPEAEAIFRPILDRVRLTGEALYLYDQPYLVFSKNEKIEGYLNLVYQPYKETSGVVSGVMVLCHDVTKQVLARQEIEEIVTQRTSELAQANEALVKSNQELQRSNANLEEFAHAASHDLKEPIRKIHFFTDKLKHQLANRLSDEEQQTFQRIHVASERMGKLVDDLLLYSHVSQHPHEKEAIDLNEKIRKVLDDLELDIQQKNATITVGKLPVVQGYRRQLQQLFQNLISNALKYNKPGVLPVIAISSDTVTVKDSDLISGQDGNKTFHIIQVKDNGIGFEQKDAERIFNVFTRLHGDAAYKGTGVGLSIVRKVIENHNGYIEAQGEPGQGATFKIYLPKTDS